MRSRLETILITLLLVILLFVGMYVYWSLGNPYVVQIIIGSIAVSLLLGSLSTFTQRYIDKRIENKPVIAVLLMVTCLVVLVAMLVALSNTPTNISREIPVMYLVDPNTKELASDLIHLHHNTYTNVCYTEAQVIFRKFKEKNPEDANDIKKVLGTLNPTIHPWLGWKYFQNLTEYLIPQYIAGVFMTPEADRTTYRSETGDWLGLPDKKIRGKPITIESTSGDFKSNVFYGVKGLMIRDDRNKLNLPKETKVSLEREHDTMSRFIIKNNYLEIAIGVKLFPMESQGPAFMDDSALLPYASSNWEGVKGFKRYQTMVYYDVTFNKLRYAFPEMQHYEKWANSLFSLLQRSFAWGNPKVLNDREVRMLIRQYEKKAKEK